MLADSPRRPKVIHTLDVGATEPGSDDPDRQEDEALSVGPDGRGMGADRAFDARSRAAWSAA